jgi:hypothetical protein
MFKDVSQLPSLYRVDEGMTFTCVFKIISNQSAVPLLRQYATICLKGQKIHKESQLGHPVSMSMFESGNSQVRTTNPND